MLTTDNCSLRCEAKRGYTIFPVRIGALPKDNTFAPLGADQCKDAPATIIGKLKPLLGPQPQKSRYVLRMLRKGGYIYVYCKGRPKAEQWQAFYTSDQGALIPIRNNLGHGLNFDCNLSPNHPHNVRTVCIADADKAGETWLGFSPNYWTPEFRSLFVEGDPAKLGMVKLDLTKAPDASTGLGATADNIGHFVADFAVGNSNKDNMVATSPLWDENTRGPQATKGHAQDMVTVMQKQAAENKDKIGIVALPDIVGLGVDINAHRLLYKPWRQKSVNDQYAWELASDSMLTGFENSVTDYPARFRERLAFYSERARKNPGSGAVVTLEQWNRGLQNGLHMENLWQEIDPIPGYNFKNPGVIIPKKELFIAKSKAYQAWASIEEKVIDKKKRETWQKTFADAMKPIDDDTRHWEKDWLDLADCVTMHSLFSFHWDPNEPNLPHAICPANHGQLYQESVHSLFSAPPTSGENLVQRYLDITVGRNPGNDNAIYLRALVGNQKKLWEYGSAAHDFLSGDILRDNKQESGAVRSALSLDGLGVADESQSPDNARDKAYDIFKGLVEASGAKQYRWVTAASAGFSLGLVTAAAAAVGSLANSPNLRFDTRQNRRMVTRLLSLQWIQQITAASVEFIGKWVFWKSHPGLRRAGLTLGHFLGVVPLPQLVFRQLPALEALKIKGVGLFTTKVGGKIMRQLETGMVTVAQMVWRGPGTSQGKATAQRLQDIYGEALELYSPKLAAMAASNSLPVDPMARKAAESLAKQGAELVEELPMARNLAIGGMVVQGLGLISSWDDVLKLLKNDPYLELDKKLGVLDAAAGFTTGLLELYQVAYKATLIVQLGGAAGAIASAQQASIRLLAARSAAQLLGVASGFLNAGIAGYLEAKARKAENLESAEYYERAKRTFYAGTAVQIAVAVEAITAQFMVAQSVAVTTAAGTTTEVVVARGVITRLVRSIALRYAAGAVLSAAGISTAMTGVGLILLIAGTAFMFIGSTSDRTALEVWFSKSKFGNSQTPYSTLAQELRELEAALQTAKAEVKEAEQSTMSNPVAEANLPL